MELLVHVNKRLKSRPAVQLPVETLLLQYQDPAASSFLKVSCQPASRPRWTLTFVIRSGTCYCSWQKFVIGIQQNHS